MLTSHLYDFLCGVGLSDSFPSLLFFEDLVESDFSSEYISFREFLVQTPDHLSHQASALIARHVLVLLIVICQFERRTKQL